MSLLFRLFFLVVLVWLPPAALMAWVHVAVQPAPWWMAVGAVLLSMLLAAWAAQHGLRRPVRTLLRAADRFRAGNHSARSGMAHGGDDFGRLAQAFDDMAAAVSQREQDGQSNRSELARLQERFARSTASSARILSAASHDLRQPLQAMNLSVALLSARHAADNDTAALRRIKTSIAQIGNQLDVVVEAARLDAGLVQAAVEPFALQPLFDAVMAEFGGAAAQKSVALACAPAPWRVRSDPRLLAEMLRSLVGNALRYTPGGGSVQLEAMVEGERLRIGVRDSGIGIGAERQAALKTAFATEGPSEDVGLGLTIVKQAAHLLGHAVTFESISGQGSVFRIELPLAPDGLAAAATGAAPVDGAGAHAVRQTGDTGMRLHGRLLVVEDDGQSSDATAAALLACGLRVVSALAVEDAVDTLEQGGEPFDALVVRHAGADPAEWQALQSILERWPGVAVLLAAGVGTDAVRQSLARSGALLLTQPLIADLLAQALPRLKAA